MSPPLSPFARACAEAVANTLEMPAEAFTVTSPPRPELGDFAVGCFPAAKQHRAAPPQIARDVAARIEASALIAGAEASGPFVNFRIVRSAVFSWLARRSIDGRMLDIATGEGQTVCVDYSSPNISKQLAYHHIRSTVIGHALVSLNRAVGYRVVGINHLGDWGTTHGMLLAAFDRWDAGEALTIASLNALYVRFREAMKSDPSLEEAGRDWFLRLERGDELARSRWQEFRDVSWSEFESVYKTLGIEFDEVKGESEFEDRMPAVLEMLANKGLSSESEGALVVPIDDKTPPLLLRKKDGATLYATRDLAAAIYRWEAYGFAKSLYVVDRGQSLHFRQLFTVLERAGFEWATKCEHVPFGLVRIEGRKTGTRSGNVVLLTEVLAEAQERAAEKIRENNQAMSESDIAITARQVGVGAIVFANLVSSRQNDVDFELAEILSLQGDTGPYVQYGYARCQKIAAKASEMGTSASAEADFATLSTDLEWALALRLAEFADHVGRAAEGSDPHVVARYLLDLVSSFSRWYTEGNGDPALRILCEDARVRTARVTLTGVVAATVREGLRILGIESPPAM